MNFQFSTRSLARTDHISKRLETAQKLQWLRRTIAGEARCLRNLPQTHPIPFVAELNGSGRLLSPNV